MAVLPTQSFATIVSQIATGMQGRATALLNFAVGSVLRAMAEAYAGVSLWLQGFALQVALLTRLATSFGSDVDSFVADTAIVTRLGSQPATGNVTFARFTPGPSAPFIPVGTTVQTGDGTQKFSVTAAPTNPAYSATLNGYTMPAQVGTLNVPVISITPSPNSTTTPPQPGANGNVAAGSISVISSSVPGIDTVSNSAAFTNGSDQETDAALKARFRLAILGLSKGDLFGTQAAIAATSVTVQFTIMESFAYGGAFAPGSYYVVADDGSGSPTSTFLAAINAAVQSVRPLAIQATVVAPTVTTANVSMVLTTAAGFVHSTVVAQVAALIATNINSLGLGNGLPYNILSSWAFSIPGVTNVSSILLNSGTADIPASNKATIKVGTLTVS